MSEKTCVYGENVIQYGTKHIFVRLREQDGTHKMLRKGRNDEKMNQNDLPIGVVDSGVGGISVLGALLKQMPEENYLYYGDSANAPYGEKTRAEVLAITRKNLALLRARGIKAFVIACNTATGAAAEVLRAENPGFPIIGIEPAVKPASLLGDHPRVLVMATPLTLAQEKFRALAARFADEEEVIPLPCPGLVELVERGNLHGDVLDRYLEDLFAPYRGEKIDAVVLGCTHYPHIKDAIAAHLPRGVVILDGGDGTARQTRRRLEELGLKRKTGLRGTVTLLNSSPDPVMLELSQKLLKNIAGPF